MNKAIISIKEFPGEYTAIQYIDEVKRVNYVCFDCGLHISNFTKKNVEGSHTGKIGICNLCLEKDKVTIPIRHFT